MLCPSDVHARWPSRAYLADHDWQDQIKAFREMYRERRDAMLEALERAACPPARTWTVPDGGFYVWVTLPDGLDAKAMLPRAVTARVAYVPGTAFYADGHGRPTRMRLSYCYPDARADPRGRPPAGRRRSRRSSSCAQTFGAAPPPGRTALDGPDQAAPGPEHRHEPTRSTWHASSCSPAGSRTSATCRCARAAGSPRRCAAPGSRSTSATSTPTCSPLARRRPPDVRRARCCTARPARTARCATCSSCSASPTSAPRPTPCRVAFDKPVAKAVVARAGIATPTRVALPHATFRELGAAAVLDALVDRLGLPLWSSRRAAARRSARRSCATAADLPGAMVGCFAYGDTALVERTSRAPRSRCPSSTTGDGPRRPARRRDRARRRLLRLRRPLHRRRHRVLRARPGCRRRARRRCAEVALRRARRRSACATCPAPTSIVDADGTVVVPRGQRRARHDRDLAAPAGRRGGRPRPRRAVPRRSSSGAVRDAAVPALARRRRPQAAPAVGRRVDDADDPLEVVERGELDGDLALASARGRP